MCCKYCPILPCPLLPCSLLSSPVLYIVLTCNLLFPSVLSTPVQSSPVLLSPVQLHHLIWFYLIWSTTTKFDISKFIFISWISFSWIDKKSSLSTFVPHWWYAWFIVFFLSQCTYGTAEQYSGTVQTRARCSPYTLYWYWRKLGINIWSTHLGFCPSS